MSREGSPGGTPGRLRTVGVEEELLLVDAETGVPLSVASQVLRVARGRGDTDRHGALGGSLGPELQQQMIETDTPPEDDLAALETDLVTWREKARSAALDAGALVLASGTSPVRVQPRASETPRYAEIARRFGLTAREQLTCGCHVHVSVASADEAVGAMDRIRVWLPTLMALSANSPFWQGTDSSYESYRNQVWSRWPTAGPPDVHGTASAYRDHVQRMLDTGVPLDEGMVYDDARPSRHYPTLEIRVADVCLDPKVAVLVAGLCRALVETAADEWRTDEPPVDAPVALLRLAMWQASRWGLSGDLLDPLTHRPRSARAVVDALVDHAAEALGASGDLVRVEDAVDELFAVGTGAARQRAVWLEERDMERVVVRLAGLT
ncbi:carboxylate--amine ligase [Nocardioides sp. Root614]|nr:carboxylate--amine ligase [Nocardioides sp. Root614]KRA93448.1 carboxylate--amine ligase [Nocardioides sp. Root682]